MENANINVEESNQTTNNKTSHSEIEVNRKLKFFFFLNKRIKLYFVPNKFNPFRKIYLI